MASQTVPAAKRYRISLLLDTYGELLTDKQRTFLRHYFEEDLSFGEIAKEYGVSRQAIFDSVKHGEESLENFERVLKLVGNGWARWLTAGRTAEEVAARLDAVHAKFAEMKEFTVDSTALAELDKIVRELRGEDQAGDEFEDHAPPAAEALNPVAGGNGSTNV